MSRKYQVPNQLTGIPIEVETFAEAKVVQAQLIADFIKDVESAYQISVLVEHPISGFVQAACDADGNPIVLEPAIKLIFDMEAAGQPLSAEDYQAKAKQ